VQHFNRWLRLGRLSLQPRGHGASPSRSPLVACRPTPLPVLLCVWCGVVVGKSTGTTGDSASRRSLRDSTSRGSQGDSASRGSLSRPAVVDLRFLPVCSAARTAWAIVPRCLPYVLNRYPRIPVRTNPVFRLAHPGTSHRHVHLQGHMYSQNMISIRG